MEPPTNQEEFRRDTSFMYNTWLPQALSSGVLVPSPRLQSASGGLRGLQAGNTLTRSLVLQVVVIHSSLIGDRRL